MCSLTNGIWNVYTYHFIEIDAIWTKTEIRLLGIWFGLNLLLPLPPFIWKQYQSHDWWITFLLFHRISITADIGLDIIDLCVSNKQTNNFNYFTLTVRTRVGISCSSFIEMFNYLRQIICNILHNELM